MTAIHPPMPRSSRLWLSRLAGVLGLLAGLLLMLAAVYLMHRLEQGDQDSTADAGRTIEVTRQRPETTQVVKPPEPPPPRPRQTPRAPMPQLDGLLAGIDLGIPEFAVDEFAGSAKSLLGDLERGGIMDESLVDAKPRVISRSPLTYPPEAIKRGINGYVLINILVTETGDIESAKVLESEPEGVFETAALRGVQTWRFSPARYKGQPVKVWAKQRIRFDAR